jgi:DNA-binding MarR family transcriptional regulator
MPKEEAVAEALGCGNVPDIELRQAPRRPPREIRDLEALVLDIIVSEPGLTRAAIASKLCVDVGRLHRPITNLLHAGQISREGHKERTRYRPALSMSRAPG